MNNVNKTLYIPLYGKAFVSRKSLLLQDPKAEEIWAREGFPLKGKARSKWLAYYMGMRAAVFDRWLAEGLAQSPAAAVVHIGCGLDSRALRVGVRDGCWYDVDFPDVMVERRKYYAETDRYRMVASDARDRAWLDALPERGAALVVMEGVSMYLERPELLRLLAALTGHFSSVRLLTDCYTVFAARASKYKNPINEVGVTRLYGLDDPRALEEGTGLRFAAEHALTPAALVDRLPGAERRFFRLMFTGGAAKRIYRLYEYETEGACRR